MGRKPEYERDLWKRHLPRSPRRWFGTLLAPNRANGNSPAPAESACDILSPTQSDTSSCNACGILFDSSPSNYHTKSSKGSPEGEGFKPIERILRPVVDFARSPGLPSSGILANSTTKNAPSTSKNAPPCSPARAALYLHPGHHPSLSDSAAAQSQHAAIFRLSLPKGWPLRLRFFRAHHPAWLPELEYPFPKLNRKRSFSGRASTASFARYRIATS